MGGCFLYGSHLHYRMQMIRGGEARVKHGQHEHTGSALQRYPPPPRPGQRTAASNLQSLGRCTATGQRVFPHGTVGHGIWMACIQMMPSLLCFTQLLGCASTACMRAPAGRGVPWRRGWAEVRGQGRARNGGVVRQEARWVDRWLLGWGRRDLGERLHPEVGTASMWCVLSRPLRPLSDG